MTKERLLRRLLMTYEAKTSRELIWKIAEEHGILIAATFDRDDLGVDQLPSHEAWNSFLKSQLDAPACDRLALLSEIEPSFCQFSNG